MRGRHRTARIGPATRAYLRRVGRRGSTLGVLAVVALVPVLATAGTVVPSIAAATLAAGASEVTGNGAELAAQLPSEESDDAAAPVSATADTTQSCPVVPPDGQALAPSGPCSVSEPAAVAAQSTADGASTDANPVVSPVSSVSGGTVFDAGNIISDAVFYNTSAMTVEQIRVFLRSEGEGCAGAVLPEEPSGDDREPAGGPVSARPTRAASTRTRPRCIAKVSTACGINPQVMLVTLQKESGLLGRIGSVGVELQRGVGLALPGHRSRRQRQLRSGVRGLLQPGLRDGQAVVALPGRPGAVQLPGRPDRRHPVERGRVRLRRRRPVTIAEHRPPPSLYNYTPYQPNAGRAGRLPRASATPAPPTATATSSTCSASTSAPPAAATSTTVAARPVLATGTTVHDPEQPVRVRRRWPARRSPRRTRRWPPGWPPGSRRSGCPTCGAAAGRGRARTTAAPAAAAHYNSCGTRRSGSTARG